ncbi:MAG: YciI family protein [Sandaracinaceae bacterium]
MRVMVLVKADEAHEAGEMPSEEVLRAMGEFNEELVKAGVLLAGEGLHPSRAGKRVRYDDPARPTVTDGPFSETKELIGGFWLWQVRSMDEALEWARRAPFRGGEIELRPVLEPDDFGEAFTPELRAQEERQREAAAKLAKG